MGTTIDRRRFLTGAAGATLLGTALVACGGGNSSAGSQSTTESTSSGGAASTPAGGSTPSGGGSGSSGGTSAVPTLVPYTGVTPDLPAGDHGLPPGFFHFPANPPAFVTGPVGNGDSVSIMIEGTAGTQTPRGDNPWWQALEKAWNVKLVFNETTNQEYMDKLQTSIAGGQIGDFTQIPNGGFPGKVLPQLPQVLETMFTDLTPYLGGDAIKDYPGLASIPTSTWTQIATVNGKIWGIAQPRPAVTPVVNYRQSIFTKAGVTADLNDGQDFVNLFKALTDLKTNRYAMGQLPTDWLLPLILEMMEAPNDWAVDNGKFTSAYESDQMSQALAETAKLWKAGYIQPDSFVTSATLSPFEGGLLGLYSQHFPGWGGAAAQLPDDTVGVLRLPKWNGGGPAPQYLGVPGYADPVGLKKTTDEKRITELLRIANYIAAPFGTQEYLLANYGVVGHDYTLNGADPVSTKAATSDVVTPVYAGGQSSTVLYAAGNQKLVTAQHQFLSDVLPTAIPDPSLGLYSATAAGAGVAAAATLHNVQNDVIQGRKSTSDWATAVASWRTSVGDKMRSEYEDAYAASH